jgi:hypothetical protein
MGLAPSREGANPGKSAVAKVPVPIFSQPRSVRFSDLPPYTKAHSVCRPQFTAHGEAVKKWDWLRAETAKTVENQRARRCLSQFLHSLGVCLLLCN